MAVCEKDPVNILFHARHPHLSQKFTARNLYWEEMKKADLWVSNWIAVKEYNLSCQNMGLSAVMGLPHYGQLSSSTATQATLDACSIWAMQTGTSMTMPCTRSSTHLGLTGLGFIGVWGLRFSGLGFRVKGFRVQGLWVELGHQLPRIQI